MSNSDIAIIAQECRFPKSPNSDQFWKNLIGGVDCVTTFSKEDCLADGIDSERIKNPYYIRALGFLEDLDLFDHNRFNIPPSKAKVMDPQHRHLLEVCLQAYEHAQLGNSESSRIGVYAGCSSNRYWLHHLQPNLEITGQYSDYELLLANSSEFLATRLSYKLGLGGPSVTINTACSTGLVLVHYACQGLLSYECDIALVGAASLHTLRKEGYLYTPGGNFSKDGKCRPFDQHATGMVGGNGVASLVLKRLEDAQADNDTIYSVIKSTAINNDGNQKIGFTAPSPKGQAEVIMMAQELADIHPEEITYIEAHGTGTILGDPIEIEGLTTAFNQKTSRKQFCKIGAVKSNIGHLDTCAGLAGLIKTSLCLQHQQLVPTLHFNGLNPNIHLENTPFSICNQHEEWLSDSLRKAGVSAFGIGGTNAHVILEEYAQKPQKTDKTELSFSRESFWVNRPVPNQISLTTPKEVSPQLTFFEGIKQIWKEVLGHSDISATDDYFELGGDSFMALKVCDLLKERYDIVCDPDLLIEKSTLETFTTRLQNIKTKYEESSLITVLKEGAPTHPPIICIHPIGGTTFVFKSLIPYFENLPNPVLAIRAKGVLPTEEPQESIEEMAKTYSEALHKISDLPPKLIIGYSLGGVIGYEICQQMKEKKPILCMIDTPYPKDLPEYDRSLTPEDQQDDPPHLKALKEVHYKALKNYNPQPLGCSISYFKASTSLAGPFKINEYQWTKQNPSLIVENIPGNHFSVLDQQNIGFIGKKLSILATL